VLGGGIHDGEIHAADPVRCRRGPARRRLGGGVGWPVDAIVIEAGAFGGVPATGAGVPVDLLPGPRLQATASACRHCPGPATATNRGTRLAWPRFSQDRRAYVTIPEYDRPVVDVSGSAARLAAPVARPRAATIRQGGIRWRPGRGCCAPPASSAE
jgi:hypothetical protein